MSHTLIQLLYQKYQTRVEIDVLANEWCVDLISRMPEVNSVIINPITHGKLMLGKRISIGRKLRAKHYDQAFILPNSIKSALTPYFAKIQTRTGFIGEMRYGLINQIYKLDKSKLPRMIDRFCALTHMGEPVASIPHPKLSSNAHNQKHLRDKFTLPETAKVIAFCPAAEYGPSKRWPEQHFATLANLLIDRGYTIIILGSKKDTVIGNNIVKLVDDKYKDRVIDTCGKTTLPDSIDLLALSTYVITNDSGLMHVACAVGAPVIALYGSSSPSFTPPLSERAQILHITLECSPCFQRTCRYGHYNCLKLITPEMVMAKMTK